MTSRALRHSVASDMFDKVPCRAVAAVVIAAGALAAALTAACALSVTATVADRPAGLLGTDRLQVFVDRDVTSPDGSTLFWGMSESCPET